MTDPVKRIDEERLEKTIGNLLRAGVIAAAAVVAFGGLIYLARHGGEEPNYHVFRGEPASLRSLSGIVGEAFALRGRGIIQLGLVLLIATPVSRVAFAAVGFTREKDYTYVVASLIVLSVLVLSNWGSFR